MDDIKQGFRKYFKAGNRGFIFSMIACIIGIGLMTLPRVMPKLLANENSAVLFNADDSKQDGKYTYIDIIAIDDYSACQGSDYYYLVMDTDHLFNVVKIDQSTYNQMKEQQAYWITCVDDETGELAPKPYRLYGVQKLLTNGCLEAIGASYKKSPVEMHKYVGSYYFSNGVEYDKDTVRILFLVGIVVIFNGAVSAFKLKKKNKNIENTIAYLESTGRLYEAWNELQTYLQTNKDGYCVILDNYVVSKQNGMMRPYEDILWAYRYVMRRNFVVVNQYALCRLVDGGKMELTPPGFNKKGAIEEILNTIAMKNPSVLLGYTTENQRAYNEMIKH